MNTQELEQKEKNDPDLLNKSVRSGSAHDQALDQNRPASGRLYDLSAKRGPPVCVLQNGEQGQLLERALPVFIRQASDC
jgi:hypothetical protein